MAGLKISICFWYIDDNLVEEIVQRLVDGNYEPQYRNYRNVSTMKQKLLEGNIDLIISDFDLPEALRDTMQQLHQKSVSHIPLIYLVGEKNELKAAETLKKGVWDYLLKHRLAKLVPIVYSSQKYAKVIKHSQAVESELHESETKYQSIFNSVQDGILQIEPATRNVVDINDSIYAIFGFDRELSKEVVIDWLSNKTHSYCRSELNKIIGSKDHSDSLTYLCQNEKINGEKFWTENTLSQFEQGTTSQYILVIRNIQDQKLMEESLHKSREHFRNLAENSPDIIMRFDRKLKHIYVNETVTKLLGIPVEEFIHKSHEEMGIFPDDLIAFWEESLKQVFRTKETHRVEFDFKGEDKVFSFEWRLFPEFDKDGNIQTVLTIARDITNQKNAVRAMQENENRLKLAVEATSLGLWDWNLENDTVYFSPIYFTMLGYEPDELPHKLDTWLNLLHPEDKDRVVESVDENIRNLDDSFEIEFRCLCKDGTYKWICGRGRILEHENGTVKRLIGTHEDISLRKYNDGIHETLFNISNAVNTTKNLNELYEKIREYLHEIIDTTNCFLALYNEETKMLSLPFHRDEVDSFSEFPAGKTLTGYVIQTGKAQLIDAEREGELTEQGHIEPVGSPCNSWLGVPLRTDSKTVGVFVVQSYSEDVIYTEKDVGILEFVSGQIALAIERKQDQDNIKENQERQRRIFESSPDPIIVVNPKGSVIDYNTSFLSVLNISTEQIIGQNIFSFIEKTDRRQAIIDFRRTWKEGYIKNLEYLIRRADGQLINSEVSTGAIYTNDGEPESMVIIVKDISRRKEFQRNLVEAKEKAEESDKLKTAFLSNMSHEIRTPMNAIVGFSNLLNDPDLSLKEREEFIGQINLGAENLMHLIDDIIDIAKIEAGQIKVNKQRCSLNRIFDELQLMFKQNMSRMDKSAIDLRLNWNFPIENLQINTDQYRLKQILINLLNNAIKFTHEGYIELGVEATDSNDHLKIYVEDSGIGISDEKKEIIFERFMQGHISKTKLYGGTGLGLAISKNLTALLGGDIGVETEVNKGSRFWFTIPLEIYTEEIIEDDVPDNKMNKNWKDKTILVAEDDDSNYILVHELLKQTGIQIKRAHDGKQAIELFEEINSKLSLVLMDIQLPEMDGYQCTRLIKERNPEMPVVAQTAYAMAGEKELCIEAGCDDYISKPIQVKNLFNLLTKYLS